MRPNSVAVRIELYWVGPSQKIFEQKYFFAVYYYNAAFRTYNGISIDKNGEVNSYKLDSWQSVNENAAAEIRDWLIEIALQSQMVSDFSNCTGIYEG